MVPVPFAEIILNSDGHPVGRNHKGLVGNSDKIDSQAGSAQHVVDGQGFDVLEAVGKKNIDSFHNAKYKN